VLICAIALIIGLSVGLTKSDDPGPEPVPPVPPVPPTPIEFNPYKIEEDSLTISNTEISGKAMAGDLPKYREMHSKRMNEVGIKAEPKLIHQGINNQLFEEIHFEFGQTDYTMARAMFTWNDK
jgi:hypothetical protein